MHTSSKCPDSKEINMLIEVVNLSFSIHKMNRQKISRNIEPLSIPNNQLFFWKMLHKQISSQQNLPLF